MSKITNDSLTRSGTRCLKCTHMAIADIKKLIVSMQNLAAGTISHLSNAAEHLTPLKGFTLVTAHWSIIIIITHLAGGGLVCSATATWATGGGGSTAAGTTAIDCCVSVGAAAIVTRCGSATTGSIRRDRRGGGWLSPPDGRDGWLRSKGCGTAAPTLRYGPLPRRGLNTPVHLIRRQTEWVSEWVDS